MINTNKVKIVVAASIPPPVGGQSIMIENMINGEYKNFEFIQIETALSTRSEDIGKFSIIKVFKIIKIILKIIIVRFTSGASILYYPPGGQTNWGFLIRDLIILNCTRMFYRKLILHFHAAGISEFYPSLNRINQYFYRRAFFYADLGIQLSDKNPPDMVVLKSKKKCILPNGLKDFYNSDLKEKYADEIEKNDKLRILFLGRLVEEKGLHILLEAVSKIKYKTAKITIDIIGSFDSTTYRMKILQFLDKHNLHEAVTFYGEICGAKKNEIIAKANLFIFPTYYICESFGLVILEAYQFSIPVIASRWRGVQDLVIEDETGFLFEIKNTDELAKKISYFINNKKLLTVMGQKGRKLFLDKYTLQSFHSNLEAIINSI